MKIPLLPEIETAEAARNIAIDWQDWVANQSLSYRELNEWSNFFEILAKDFNLTEEFRENGII